ncbi:MAG: DUF4278 domain-containing protein [Aphanocapsa sp. GSE-SYN-MK-11-07L]|nr:DUF4278 domain-containing protein [Aphanocapsa sp. GSE-SYN-MK-11-07L]
MKLTDRGNSYEVPAPVQQGSDATDQPKIKLIYRGNTIDYVPPLVVSEVDKRQLSSTGEIPTSVKFNPLSPIKSPVPLTGDCSAGAYSKGCGWS